MFMKRKELSSNRRSKAEAGAQEIMSIDDVPRRNIILQLTALSQSGRLPGGEIAESALGFGNCSLQATILATKDCFWARKSADRPARQLRLTSQLSGKHEPQSEA